MEKFESEVITNVHLETLAKSIYDESAQMGFKSGDYVKLMNHILGMTISNSNENSNNNSIKTDRIKISKSFPLKGKNVNIREYNHENDKDFLIKWFEDEVSKLFLLSTTSARIQNIENLISDENNLFGTITLKDNTPIGLLAVLNVDKKNNKGEMRKLIGDVKQRGKGYAKEASILWINYCSEILGLNKIYISTIDTNIKNISLNRQLGFQIEGLLKKECTIENIEHDVLRMAYFKKI